MNYQTLLLENANGVLTLTINREKALNALNATVFAELEQFFGQDYKSVADLKGVIIKGAGEKAFVAGADITEFAGFHTPADAVAKSKYGQDVFFLIERFHLPVIALVNGFALGGGCELAMACHLRVATATAKFGQPEVNLGIIPGYGGTQRLVQLIGKGKALELLMTADMIDATEAHRLGLANYVCENIAEAQEKSAAIIAKIATKAPIAVAKVIESVNAYYDITTEGFAYEYNQFGDLSATQDFKEGAAAFVEKRKAVFQNK